MTLELEAGLKVNQYFLHNDSASDATQTSKGNTDESLPVNHIDREEAITANDKFWLIS